MSIQDKATAYVSDLDKELSKYSTITNFEKVYAVLGLLSIYVLFIFFNFGGQLLSNLVGFIFPAYESLKAIESKGTQDDTQWLTYWVVFAGFTIVEYFSGTLLYWFPFFYFFKTAFILWLALPQFRGAQYLYASLIRPVFLKFHSRVEATVEHPKTQ